MALRLSCHTELTITILNLILSTVGSSLPFTVSDVVIGKGNALPPEFKIRDDHAFYGDYSHDKENIGRFGNTLSADKKPSAASKPKENSPWNARKTPSNKDIKTPLKMYSQNEVEFEYNNGFQPYYGLEEYNIDDGIGNPIEPETSLYEYESSFTNIYEDVDEGTTQDIHNFPDVDEVSHMDAPTEYYGEYHPQYDGWVPYFAAEDQYYGNHNDKKQEDATEHYRETYGSLFDKENTNYDENGGLSQWNKFAFQDEGANEIGDNSQRETRITNEINSNGWVPYYGYSEDYYSEDYNENKVEPEIITLESLEDYLKSEGIYNLIVKSMLLIGKEQKP